jgi:hypothetical protein
MFSTLPTRSHLGLAAALWLLCAENAANAEPTESVAAPPAETTAVPTEPDKSYVLPALEIIGFDFLLSRYNRHFSGSSDYDVSAASIRRNLKGPWVVDNDPFKVNQFAHPYQGSLYHGAARATGLNYWEASALTFAGSAWWEITGEQTPPSRNDQVASGIAGSFLGEPLFRMAHLVLKNDGSMPYIWREWSAAAISPAVGFNRLAFGPRFDHAFEDHNPVYYGRLHVGGSHITRSDLNTPTEFKHNAAEIDFALDYGLPGKPGYTYHRPFDYFSFQAQLSSANGVENLSTRGLLMGTDYALGDNYRGIWGLYANYDYLAPQIFHVSTTSLSIGTTAQWWVAPSIALQGTALAGLGYAAASTTRGGVLNDREYHYGTAPRVALALRVIASDRASADISARMVSVGRLNNRADGNDDISRVDSALTWRIHGAHAVGVSYVWSHRSASYPDNFNNKQTLGKIGVYYTLLGKNGFGAVAWDAPNRQ